MYRISFPALIIAFFAELAADWVIQFLLLLGFGGSAISGDMSQADLQKVFETVSVTPAFLTVVVILGSGTTFGGGYLAARFARKFPYYHGLAMGLMGLAYILYYWRANETWMNVLGVLTNIPLSIGGAHLAKRHIPEEE